MTITSDLLRRLLNLGADSDLFVLAARFAEVRRNGPHELHCIISGFEAAAGDRDLSGALSATLKELLPPERPEAANDIHHRMSTYQKRIRFGELVERDGPTCSECNRPDRTIWRRMGVWSLEDGGKYTKVQPTSNLEVDHKTPLWAGGDNSLENLWLLCVDCHKVKTAREAGERRRA